MSSRGGGGEVPADGEELLAGLLFSSTKQPTHLKKIISNISTEG